MKVTDWLGESNTLGIDIWTRKYQNNGETFDEWLDRISGGDSEIRQEIANHKFLFGGRILANRGLSREGRKITYSNCYVMSAPQDNLESIFDTAKKLARTYSYGGGCGVDLGKLAPRGAVVRNAAKTTSGSTTWMDLYSMVTGLIGQNGRRGALMLSLPVDHPDVEEFIGLKADLNKITKANTSVRVTSEFMNAVKTGSPFTLSFTRPETGETITKTVDAKALFACLARMNWDYAEPGILNWDRISSWNLLSEDDSFSYAGTNPCAEEPLPAGGSCLLGSINLAAFVKNGAFDFHDFRHTVSAAVKALNDVLDEGMPLHPLEEQRASVKDWRQIGLGLFGLADALIRMGLTYGSEESLAVCDQIGAAMSDEALKASALLAKEYGTLYVVN